jgi:signal recognition particle subunit SRP54
LLEADVALPVVKDFITNIKPKAIGQEIIKSTSPWPNDCKNSL